MTVSPELGGPSTRHVVQVTGLTPGMQAVTALLAPDGSETVTQIAVDTSGSGRVTLSPPSGGWQEGVYRGAVQVQGVQSESAVFVSNDGGEHLYAQTFEPSVTSSFVISGTGLKPDTDVEMIIHLTGLRGDIPFHATTDAAGVFQTFLRPEQTGMGFYPAGPYRVEIVGSALSVLFSVREWPAQSLMDVSGAVQAGGSVHVLFHGYLTGDYVWGETGDEGGQVAPSEFLVGPVNASGAVSADLSVPAGPGGAYFLETPYQRGQTVYTVVAPTPTMTATATSTPTATPTPTPIDPSLLQLSSVKRCLYGGGNADVQTWRHAHCRVYHWSQARAQAQQRP
jgi:hypothetical protein